MASAVYADANTTTAAPPEVLAAARKGENHGHPLHGSKAVAEFARRAISRLHTEVESAIGAQRDEFVILHASDGATANDLIIRTCVAAYRKRRKRCAHIVIGDGESASVMGTLNSLSGLGVCKYNVAHIDPAAGAPTAETVKAAITRETCLVCVAGATLAGGMLDVAAVSKVCWAPAYDAVELPPPRHAVGATQPRTPQRRIPLHCDMTTTYPRAPPDARSALDSFSVGLHQMHSVPGLGLLVVRKTVVEGYGLESLTAGVLPNLPAILAGVEAHKFTMADRVAKNRSLARLVTSIETVLAEAARKSQVPRAAGAAGAAGPAEAHAPFIVTYRRDDMAQDSVRAADKFKAAEFKACREGDDHGAAHRNGLWKADEVGTWRYRPATAEVVIYGPEISRRLPNTLLLAIAGPAGKLATELKDELEDEGVRVCAPTAPYARLLALGVPSAMHRQLILVSLPDGTTKESAQKIAIALVKVAKNA